MFDPDKLLIATLSIAPLGLGVAWINSRISHRQAQRNGRFYASVSASNQAVTSSKDQHELIERICTAGKEKTGYLRASVIDRFGNVIFDTDGRDAITDGSIGLSLLDTFECAKRHEPFIIKKSLMDTIFKRNSVAIAIYPIFIDSHAALMLCIVAKENEHLDNDHLEVLKELVGDIEFGIKTFDLDNKHRHDKTDDSAYLKNHDYLTGLPNKNKFMADAEALISRFDNNNSGKVAFFYISVNELNSNSDNVWIHNSDEVIKQLSGILITNLSSQAIIHRVGYADFLIVKVVQSKESVKQRAEQILQAISIISPIDNMEVDISPTVGISLYPDNGKTVGDLAVSAQRAVFNAGKKAKRIILAETEQAAESRRERIKFEAALKKSLTKGELELYYQPQVDLETCSIIGYEALVRWNNPVLGIIQPDKFIELAEKNGFIIEMGHWVVQQACRQIVAWKKVKREKFKIAVNVSPIQFYDDDLLDVVKAAIKEYSIEPGELEFEITESAIMEDEEHAIKLLKEFRNLGLVLSIDDFGVGHSSLSYLKKLPVHKVKIDRSFIENLPNDSENATIVKAILNIAEGLKMQVVAEGIETREQEEFMQTHKCLHGQGRRYGMPTKAEDIN